VFGKVDWVAREECEHTSSITAEVLDFEDTSRLSQRHGMRWLRIFASSVIVGGAPRTQSGPEGEGHERDSICAGPGEV